ncbi:phage protein [Bergeriella denitrificans]|uniref:Phage protein n=2 Tax=Bergeriella denitrificans TaxID=494 RepID=A0A378UFK8_BERDE|nr:phage tail assembly protein [Bergeriella denitrificans]STZ76107.1 phage protein [Bergeriella denitrificans]
MTQAKQLHSEMGISQDVKLKYPVRLPTGEVLEKVSVRRPKVGDIRAAAHLGSDAEQELFIFARLTGLVPEDLDMLDFADYKEIQRVFRLMQEQE